LGSNKELFEAVKLGGLQVTTTASSFTTSSFPESGLFDLPFLFRDFEHAIEFLDGSLDRVLRSGPQKAGRPDHRLFPVRFSGFL